MNPKKIYISLSIIIIALWFLLYNNHLIIIHPFRGYFNKLKIVKDSINERNVEVVFYNPFSGKKNFVFSFLEKKTLEESIASLVNQWGLYISQEENNKILTTVDHVALGKEIIIINLMNDVAFEKNSITLTEFNYITSLFKTIKNYNNNFKELYLYTKQNLHPMKEIFSYVNDTMINSISKNKFEIVNEDEKLFNQNILIIPIFSKPHGNLIDDIYEDSIYKSIKSNNLIIFSSKKMFLPEWFMEINNIIQKNNSDFVLFIEIIQAENNSATLFLNPYQKLENYNNCILQEYHFKKITECSTESPISTNIKNIYNYIASTIPIDNVYYADHKAFSNLIKPTAILNICVKTKKDIDTIKILINNLINSDPHATD